MLIMFRMFGQSSYCDTSKTSRVSSSLVKDLGLDLEEGKPEKKSPQTSNARARVRTLLSTALRKAPVVTTEPTEKKNDGTGKKFSCS